MQRQEKNRDKAERRKTRKEDRSKPAEPGASDVDPDTAHIVWGPQPDHAADGGASSKEAASGARDPRKGDDGLSSKDDVGGSRQ